MCFKRPEFKSKVTGTTTLPVCGKDVDLHSSGEALQKIVHQFAF